MTQDGHCVRKGREMKRQSRHRTSLDTALTAGIAPCPYCGAQARLNGDTIQVWCPQCGALGPNPISASDADAIRLWNAVAKGWRRLPDDAIQDRITRLEMEFRERIHALEVRTNIINNLTINA